MTFTPNDQDSADGPVNPYSSPTSDVSPLGPGTCTALNVAAGITLVCCIISLGLWLVALVVSLPYGHPNAPPLIEILAFVGMFMVLPALGLAGSISMLLRKRYWLSMVGSCCMLVPVLGPCFGLAMPVGVWAIVLLRRNKVKAHFHSRI